MPVGASRLQSGYEILQDLQWESTHRIHKQAGEHGYGAIVPWRS